MLRRRLLGATLLRKSAPLRKPAPEKVEVNPLHAVTFTALQSNEPTTMSEAALQLVAGGETVAAINLMRVCVHLVPLSIDAAKHVRHALHVKDKDGKDEIPPADERGRIMARRAMHSKSCLPELFSFPCLPQLRLTPWL